MGLKDAVMRFLRRGKQDDQRFEALQSDDEALRSVDIPQYEESPGSLEIQKDSLQLGIAAGYTGKSIRNIESTLNRIDIQMATKDWVVANFQGTLDMLVSMQKNSQEHMESVRKRLENLENLVKSIEDNIIFRKSKGNELMTAKMKEALKIIELSGEISYDDLSNKLEISVSSLRGLLSVIARRTDKIMRFEKDNKGWVSFVISSDSKRFESEQNEAEVVKRDENNPENVQNGEN